jgi:hypothetical protein
VPLEDTRGIRLKAEINISQMEIDDVGSVYHLGGELFASEEFPILYCTCDVYKVTGHFTSDPHYCPVADITAEGDIEILGIDRANTYLTRPSREEKIVEGDRLLVYANRKAVKRVLD